MPGKSQTDFTSSTVVIVLIVEEEERDDNPGDTRSTRHGSREVDPLTTKRGSLQPTHAFKFRPASTKQNRMYRKSGRHHQISK
jgi:hypothetical protein